MLPGVGIQNTQSQRLPPPPKPQRRDSIPLHLSLLPPQQSGYIILPKANFVLPKNNGPPLPGSPNRKPERRPPNGPPGKHRPPNRQRNPPVNKKANPQIGNAVAGSHNIHQLLASGPFPPRPSINIPFHEATIPQNIKLDQAGPNRPPVLPNFQPHPPILPNIKPNDFLLNNQPPRKIPKVKNRPKNGAFPFPIHEIIGTDPNDELKLNAPILSQIEHGETLDISHLLGAPSQENELLEITHIEENKEQQHLPEEIEVQPHEHHEEHQQSGPNHFSENLPPPSKPIAEHLKQHEQEKNFHIPFPDFAEPEPGPQLQPSNFNPSAPNLNLNNKITLSQESKQTAVAAKPKSSGSSDNFDHVREETVPVALYGQVLPPNDITYSSEINNFPGLHDNGDDDNWPLAMPEMPKIIHLDVKCEKNLMRISIDFDKPFHGIIYSKGHYSYGRCVHLPAGSGHNSVQFDISINSCGMQGNSPSGHYGPTETGSYFENTVVVQYDPLVQEVWDQARKLRCNWHDQYEKTVTFRPFNVDMLQVVRADFAGDNVGCWMQIQVGKGPWANEVSGIVRIGQTMTLVLAIKDDESKFDMMVRNCIAHDGNRAPIELVDSSGCVTRPKLMSRFTKVKNFGSSASVLSFAHFQAFKFPDSTEVHIQCTVQICRHQCDDQCSVHRKKREAEGRGEVREIGLNGMLQVVAVEDLTFAPFKNETDDTKIITEKSKVCMSASGFAASLILLLSIVIISCLIATFLFLKQRNNSKLPPLPYDMAVFKKHMEKQAKKQQQQQHKTLTRQNKKV